MNNTACNLQREAGESSTEQRSMGLARSRFALVLATLLVTVSYRPAQGAAERAAAGLEEVVVSATRKVDEQVTLQVQKTLTADPWIYAEHITVTTHDGVVRLEGIVGDTGELFRILRRCRKIPGARRVVSELEIVHNDPDGG